MWDNCSKQFLTKCGGIYEPFTNREKSTKIPTSPQTLFPSSLSDVQALLVRLKRVGPSISTRPVRRVLHCVYGGEVRAGAFSREWTSSGKTGTDTISLSLAGMQYDGRLLHANSWSARLESHLAEEPWLLLPVLLPDYGRTSSPIKENQTRSSKNFTLAFLMAWLGDLRLDHSKLHSFGAI